MTPLPLPAAQRGSESGYPHVAIDRREMDERKRKTTAKRR